MSNSKSAAENRLCAASCFDVEGEGSLVLRWTEGADDAERVERKSWQKDNQNEIPPGGRYERDGLPASKRLKGPPGGTSLDDGQRSPIQFISTQDRKPLSRLLDKRSERLPRSNPIPVPPFSLSSMHAATAFKDLPSSFTIHTASTMPSHSIRPL
ncbi:hypothetical protein CC1G_15800 [Coprinopsis cinerea okayama7|uniref:Uncharacterized protein n=1 Tax=Coprinopsis cinerea (strain Okayama-7 / 130 / ATCC MYA-4618 / FGSC 9003) TaxID=240176 RepID=D6RR03_COPC7|nr:hypothetical protein CC1G_15800 [Coprinopsis cinerea okayama7\|eukprot:XP_002910080.1 hypothetical protein CC1G_15800 [Coprinopsis cinerea okayama7\